MTTDTATALSFYAAHGCALFPIPAGSKAPTGIVASFAHDHSTDPAQWAAWSLANPGCNFGLVAGPSRLIVADVDVSEIGRDRAWEIWATWWRERGLPVPAPHVQSARGGWHTLFALPADTDVSTLRQVALIGPTDGSKKAIVDLRVGNGFVVAAGSYYDGTARGEQSGPYLLMGDAPPHPCPDAILAHCTRVARPRLGVVKVGTYDLKDVTALYRWLAEHGGFESYDDWVSAGMIAKVEFGDAGLDLWEIAHDDTVDADAATAKWDSFSVDATAESQALGTLLVRARSMGWRGSIQKSTAAMFDGVAAIAAAAGATLRGQPPLPDRGMPLLDTQKTVAALGQPILDNFLAGTTDAPSRPSAAFYPTIPAVLGEHPLFEQLRTAIDRIVAMAEGGSKGFRQDRVLPALAVLHGVHPPTCDELVQRITALGGVLSPGKLDSFVKNFEGKVRVEQNTAAGFITDSKGNPAPENSDNVHVFIRQRQIHLRYNVWKDQAEIADNDRGEFNQLTDHAFGDLLMDAENSQFNYHPSEGRFRRGLISNARKTMYDPLVERLDTLARSWDGTPRLDTWLARTCNTANDAYHTCVGRNLIGGLVRRARHPGCEQAETVIFINPNQGTGKSTLCKILALDTAWHTDSFKFEGSPQNSIPQLFGKWVVELSELAGMAQKDVEHIKNFMSATTDNFTKKYEAFATDHPRRCCFIGTSNSRRPLSDPSGNRRFLPVHVVGEVDVEWLRANVEQIMGECATLEAAGESFAIPRSIWDIAGQHQEQARTMSPVEEHCQEWFDRPGSFYITATDIGRALKMAGQSQHARYSSFLDKLGYRNENLTVPGDGRKCRVWVRHVNNALDQCVRLLPVQTQINGPVEMRMQQRAVAACPVPPR